MESVIAKANQAIEDNHDLFSDIIFKNALIHISILVRDVFVCKDAIEGVIEANVFYMYYCSCLIEIRTQNIMLLERK